MSNFIVKPKEGVLVRMPEKQNQPMPAHGAEVPNNSYWNRRLKDKDVIKISADAFKAAEERLRKKTAQEAKDRETKKKADAKKKASTQNTTDTNAEK